MDHNEAATAVSLDDILPPDNWADTRVRRHAEPAPHAPDVHALLATDDERFVDACADGGLPPEEMEEAHHEALSSGVRADAQDANRQLVRMLQKYHEVYKQPPVIAAIPPPSVVTPLPLQPLQKQYTLVAEAEEVMPRCLSTAAAAATTQTATATAADLDEPFDIAAKLEAVVPALNAEETLRRVLRDPRLLLTEPVAHTNRRAEMHAFEAQGARYANAHARSLDDWQRELQRHSPDPPTLGMLSTGFACVTLCLSDAFFVCCVLQKTTTSSGNGGAQPPPPPQNNTTGTTNVYYKFLGFLFCQSRRSHQLDWSGVVSSTVATSAATTRIAVHQPEVGAHASSTACGQMAADY